MTTNTTKNESEWEELKCAWTEWEKRMWAESKARGAPDEIRTRYAKEALTYWIVSDVVADGHYHAITIKRAVDELVNKNQYCECIPSAEDCCDAPRSAKDLKEALLMWYSVRKIDGKRQRFVDTAQGQKIMQNAK